MPSRCTAAGAGVGAEPLAIAIEQDDLVTAVGRDDRLHQLARVHLHAAFVLVEMTQHDAETHGTYLDAQYCA
jgi:hypothetical protein